MDTHHAVVWVDHHEAHLFRFTSEDIEKVDLVAHKHHFKNVRHQRSTHPEDLHYLQEVTEALRGAERVLVVGPSTAKLELIRHLHAHAQDVERRVVGVETVDHPTDNQLVAYARAYFKRTDALTG